MITLNLSVCFQMFVAMMRFPFVWRHKFHITEIDMQDKTYESLDLHRNNSILTRIYQ